MLLLSSSLRTSSQRLPPSRLNCTVPMRVSTAVMAMASTTTPSGSVMEPSTTRPATLMPAGLAALAAMLGKAGEALAFNTGGPEVTATTALGLESTLSSVPPPSA